MQKRNIILFALLSVLLAGVWYFFQPDTESKKEDPDKRVVQNKDEKKPKEEDKPKPKDPPKEKVVPPKVEPIKKIEPEEAPKTDVLGDDGFYLNVDVTTRGAGVRSVVLSKFQAANWRGRPTDRPLELIQHDEFTPSFRMYHYPQAKDDNPVIGLGEKNWKLEGVVKKDDLHEATFSILMPEREHIKIVKTYRLAPKDYHVTLLLEFQDTRDPKKSGGKEEFRYQLTGGHGLPIEGEWFVSLFRNAYMGLVDTGGGLYRKLEESARISGRRGGDKFPERTRADNRLQYAGVANQYFASMIVVDNDQPKDGGVDKADILAWARPTLESSEKRGVIKNISKKKDHVLFVNPIPLLNVGRALTGKDAVSKTREDCHFKVHEIRLLAGFTYNVEMASKDVTPHLIIEDSKKAKLAEAEAAGTSAKLAFRVPLEGDYRIIASGNASETGDYRLLITEQAEKYTLLPRTKQHFEDLDLYDEQEAVLSYRRTDDGMAIATWVRLGTTPRPQFDDITVRVNSEPIALNPGQVVKHQFMLYHGPVKAALLGQFTGDKEVPTELVNTYTNDLNLRTLTDYHSDNMFGKVSNFIGLTWVIIQFTKLMHWLLNLLHYVFGYGLSIVVLTVMVRGAMFPISRKQAIFSIRMQELAPELKKVQEKYADDPQAKMQATQEFYRKNGINPLGSCWPVFLQMPIFLGLYFALQESIHFRLASFWPLWIDNLAAPDMLFGWGDSIPWISQPDNLGGMLYLGPYLNILPVFAVVFMMIQQMQTMPPPTDEQQAMQQKMLKFMSVFFGIMFYKVAAGLCVYFIASSLWGMAERKLLPKKKTTGPVLATPSGSPATAASISAGPKGKNKWAKKDKVKEKEPVTAFDKIKALWREILKNAEKK